MASWRSFGARRKYLLKSAKQSRTLEGLKLEERVILSVRFELLAFALVGRSIFIAK